MVISVLLQPNCFVSAFSTSALGEASTSLWSSIFGGVAAHAELTVDNSLCAGEELLRRNLAIGGNGMRSSATVRLSTAVGLAGGGRHIVADRTARRRIYDCRRKTWVRLSVYPAAFCSTGRRSEAVKDLPDPVGKPEAHWRNWRGNTDHGCSFSPTAKTGLPLSQRNSRSALPI